MDSVWNYIIGFFVLFVLIACVGIDKAERNKKIAEAKRIANEIGYIQVRNDFLFNVFGNVEHKQRLNVSAAVVNNFSGFKYLDYLTKYFNMKVNNKTSFFLKKLYDATEKLDAAIEAAGIPAKYADALMPSFTMAYTSPGGRSYKEATVLFDCCKIWEIGTKIETLQQKSNHAKRQRSKMTPALKKAILERDNYTCQNCGNSIYKEPNLLLEIDHIIPVSKGGETEPDNLQTLCWRCNRSKSDSLS